MKCHMCGDELESCAIPMGMGSVVCAKAGVYLYADVYSALRYGISKSDFSYLKHLLYLLRVKPEVAYGLYLLDMWQLFN